MYDISDREAKELEQALCALEQTVTADKFQKVREDFMARNCCHFTVDDENKLCYTEIHMEFLKIIESYICEELTGKGVNIERLFKGLSLEANDRQLDFGASLDIVDSLTDFNSFKEMMLRAKNQFSGRRKAVADGVEEPKKKN
eukprot:TRINITY_DN6371_c1_g2_i1.p1 TRINITY_DN6371_c1_g2~~TRINITY_DN6371_c1_g2_i1.p1  ORF type:complete len:168 (+),score=20.16 TRINITY_DN6371_c1_g2_i1:77-505(+)